jgi:hypothetical protein
MSEPLKEIFLCKEGWDLFEKWLKSAEASGTREDRVSWAEYYEHAQSCEECRSLRGIHPDKKTNERKP